eukprot:gene28013-33827_t
MGNAAGLPSGKLVTSSSATGQSLSAASSSSSPHSSKSIKSIPSPSKVSPLFAVLHAVERKDWKSVQKLLQLNPQWAKLNKDDPNTMSASELALIERAPNYVLETILSIDVLQAVKPDAKGVYLIHYGFKHNAPVQTLHIIKTYDTKALERLDKDDYLPIHYAAKYHSSVEALDFLIKLQPDCVKAKTPANLIPLHVALENQAPSAVVDRLLLAYPESIRIFTDRNLPIHYACQHKPLVSVVQRLLQEYPESINIPGDEELLPVHLAVRHKANYEATLCVIQANPENLLIRDRTHRMPLHYALEGYAANDIILAILKACPETAKQRGRGTPGDFPLHTAIDQGFNSEVVLAIMQAYPHAATQKSVFHVYPLRTAVLRKLEIETIAALLDACPMSASEVDEHGRVALHYAVSRLYPYQLVEALVRSFPAGVSKYDNNGQLPIHMLALRSTHNMHAVNSGMYENYVSILGLLLDRYPQCVYMQDKYHLNAINYLIEQNASVDLYKRMIVSNLKCLQISAGAPGKLPLHHAIECQRSYDVIKLLVASYPQSTEVRNVDDKVALHLAIVRPLCIESLLCIEAAFPLASMVADQRDNLPVHYALQMHTSLKLVEKLLASNPACMHNILSLPDNVLLNNPVQANGDDEENVDDDKEELQHDKRVHCCQEIRLLHYAVAYQCSPDIIAEIMTYTMPFKPHTLEFNKIHYDTWTHLLAHTEDKYWQSVEILLDYYDQPTITNLSLFQDARMRKALDMATSKCRHVIVHRLHYFSRYELHSSVLHYTDLSMLKKAINHSEGLREPAILKFTKNLEAFENEVRIRALISKYYDLKHNGKISQSEKYILKLLIMANGNEDKNYREEATLKGFGAYPYLVVTRDCKRSLADMIRRENVSGRDEARITGYARTFIEAVDHLHAIGIMHGSIHPNHVFEQHERLVLGDFSFACDVSKEESVSTQAARCLSCTSPEIAALYLRSATSNKKAEPSIASSMKAAYSMDMWSVGAVLFHLATGESLFLTNHHNDIDSDQLDLLCQWPDYAKAKRMKKIVFPCVRNLIEQLLCMDPTLRPTASECLAHPMITGKYERLRYVGMEAKYDLYLSFRNESEDSSDLRNSLRIKQTLETQGYSPIQSLRMQPGEMKEQVLETLYNMTQARSMCIVLSRYAVNHIDFNLAQLHAYSKITLFLLELYLALELKARGMLEQGVAVICVGDVVDQTADGEMVYGPFFTHHGGEMTMKASGCMPDRIPNVFIKSIQETISSLLAQHGLGKRLLGDMGLKE